MLGIDLLLDQPPEPEAVTCIECGTELSEPRQRLGALTCECCPPFQRYPATLPHH